jgi:hypothetical protein
MRRKGQGRLKPIDADRRAAADPQPLRHLSKLRPIELGSSSHGPVNLSPSLVPPRGESFVQSFGSTRCARDGPGLNGSPKYCVSRATFPSLNSMMLTV